MGIDCPPGGPFDCALRSRLGPFLLPSDAPGGAETPAVAGPVPGKLYIADPGRSGPVTGSPLPNFIDATGASRNHNIFRIEGPAGSGLGGQEIDFIETTAFSLMGRVFTGTIPSKVDVNRASYARNATVQKLDVFATGLPAVPGRLPGQTRPPSVLPALSYFEAPCSGAVSNVTGDILPPFTAPAGAPERQMFSAGSLFWGQSRPAALPQEVCVKDAAARDANGNVVPAYFPKAVTDEVIITEALYDPSIQSLSVKAASSDQVAPPTLTLASFGVLVGGQIVVSPLAAPPATVRVLSSRGGAAESLVVTGTSAGPLPGAPVAVNDSMTFAEDSGPQTINVLANDSNVSGGTVSLTSLPRLGIAAVNSDGTVTYRSNLNASGADAFTYAVTVGATASTPAFVSITITPVNDPPVATNDSAVAFVNQTTALAVLANDADPDGPTDIVAVANLTQPSPDGATVVTAGAVVNFAARAPGNYTFSYQARDASGALSNVATVTVVAVAGDSITIARAEFRTGQARLRIEGTVSPVGSPPQRLEVRWANGADINSVVATPVPDAAGNWAVDIRDAAGIQNPLNSGATQLVVASSAGARAVANIILR